MSRTGRGAREDAAGERSAARRVRPAAPAAQAARAAGARCREGGHSSRAGRSTARDAARHRTRVQQVFLSKRVPTVPK